VRRIDDEAGAAALRLASLAQGPAAARGGPASLSDAAAPSGSLSEDGPPSGSLSEPEGRVEGPDRATLALAVRWTLQRLAEQAPGHTLEVRVPPFGAVQVIEGPRHTRGTPPNVVETDPVTWLALATGALAFSDALAAGRVQASGTRTDLSAFLPVTAGTMEA